MRVEPTPLPHDWSWTTLGEISKNGGDYGSGAAVLPYNPHLPRYVRVTDTTDNGKLDPNSKASITRADASGYFFTCGDPSFARSGSVGRTYLYNSGDGECAHAGHVIKFALNPVLCSPGFVAQWTRSSFYWRWIASTFRQGAQPNINAAGYRKLPIPAPKVTEQSRIALVLDTVDEVIAQTEAVIGKLRQLRAGLFHDLLTRGLDQNGQLRDPIAHPEQFQPSPLGPIPKEWRVAELREVAEVGSGATLGRNFDKGGAQSGGENEGGGARVCGAPVPPREDSLWASESEVSRVGQERASTLCALWTGQRGDWGASTSHGLKEREATGLKR